MISTQAQVDELLEGLRKLHGELSALRREVIELEKGYEETRRDYELKLGAVNAEAERLERLFHTLSHLPDDGKPLPASRPEPPVIPPRPVIKPESVGAKSVAAPPVKNPRRERKRVLLNYLYYFTDDDQMSDIERLNAVLDDDRHDVGDLLESLEWGDIWRAKYDWETLDEQHARLKDWREALTGRLAYWKERQKGQAGDQIQGLWERRKRVTPEQWADFLDDLARQQQRQNQRLAEEAASLQRRRRAWEK